MADTIPVGMPKRQAGTYPGPRARISLPEVQKAVPKKLANFCTQCPVSSRENQDALRYLALVQ